MTYIKPLHITHLMTAGSDAELTTVSHNKAHKKTPLTECFFIQRR